jgi:hypothetical protein
MELAGENGIKTVYDLQSYWTSMTAILHGFTWLYFTFLIDRMTEVLTPDIYRAHRLVPSVSKAMFEGCQKFKMEATRSDFDVLSFL